MTIGFSVGFGLGGPEIVVILFLLAIPVSIVILTIALVRRSGASNPPPSLPAQGSNTEARLRELDALRTAGSITDAEYSEKRQQILDEL